MSGADLDADIARLERNQDKTDDVLGEHEHVIDLLVDCMKDLIRALDPNAERADVRAVLDRLESEL